MIFDAIISFLSGILFHQTRRVTVDMPHGWSNISEHVIGWFAIFANYLYWWKRIKGIESPFWRGVVSIVLGPLFMGGGIILCWILESGEK